MYILWRIETSSNRRYLFGGLSLIIWTITLLSLIKYMVFVLSADDNGEGGIFALYALLCRHMLSSKDINFVGYTYKNVEIVNDALPRIAEAKKKSNKPKRPSVKSLFEDDESTPQGSFLNLLPAKFEETEKAVGSSSKSSSSG